MRIFKIYLPNKQMIRIAGKFVFICLLIGPVAIFGQQTSQFFTTTGTWTAPAGVTSVTVECWGGGGSGGGSASFNVKGGGGGAGGAYARKVLTVIPGNNYTVTVGSTRTGTISAGVTGNPSWFSSVSTIYAQGGAGGAAPNNGNVSGGTGSSSSSIGDVVFAGGNGAGGTTTLAGGGGGGAGSTGAGGNASGTTAGTGTPVSGGNGGAGRTTGGNGNAGSVYGGGGGGSFVNDGTDRTGGNGAAGLVVITYAINCPSSTSITPSGTQSLCLNATATQLTATVTTSGGSGTPTILYQWYFNATNSNTISSATLVSGATSSNYTPPATSAGIRYYFCVGYATNNGCGQTATTQSLASNTVQVTVNDQPGAVTVSGGGTFCGSTTLTASGGTGGTIYFQGTTSNGTSTSNPGTSQIITSTGTYYFRAMSPQGCWGTQGSATVTIIPNPTITLGANPTVCKGIISANLTYSTTSGSPNQYSIIYDAVAIGQGFANVTNSSLPASPIVMVVPSAPIPGTYNFTISVRNSTTGCISDLYSKTITVSPPAPVTPGAISGPITVNPFTTGLVYSIPTVIDATSYNWTLPAGWIITNGQGTTSIIVTSGAIGQNGNINVTASNSCGTSTASNLAVIVYDGNCPQSTTIAPTASQSVCPGGTINTMTATVTLTGGPGIPTILYQWYYNNTNTNNIVGATKITGATSSTYTPQNNVVGTQYYFCVGYASNNGCNQNDTYQNLASNTIEVTINPPAPASPGSITGQGTVPPNILD